MEAIIMNMGVCVGAGVAIGTAVGATIGQIGLWYLWELPIDLWFGQLLTLCGDEKQKTIMIKKRFRLLNQA